MHRDRISSTPSATTGPSYYGPAPTNATLMDAAVFAYASKILGARPEADLQAYAADLGARAVQAWDWAEANPSVLYYTRLQGISDGVKSAILNQFVTNVTNNSDQLPRVTENEDPYRAPLTGYTWSSNQIKMAQARLYQLLAEHGSGAAAESAAVAAEDYVHYLHGVNPFGLVYLTNMRVAGAEHSTKTMFQTWFAEGTRWDEVSDTTPGPAPGFLVGGPSPGFELDSCCTAPSGDDAYQCYGASEFSLCSQNWEPPMGQPEQKSYRDFNSGWPAGSWFISEPSTGYQAKYILVLAMLAR